MSGKISNRVLLAVLAFTCAVFSAQGQTYTSNAPYSIFGVGDIVQSGTAFNRSMGGVGTAMRNNHYINQLNPAAVTARDSLSFMADFSLNGDNRYFKQGNINSVSNTFNIGSLAMSFPIWKTSAMMLGVVPYSGIGFDYSYDYNDPSVIGITDNIKYSASGIGGLYQAFAAGGVTFFERLSLGAQFNYYFGSINKMYGCLFSDKSFSSVENGYKMYLTGTSGKFGLQYSQPVGEKGTVVFGAAYSTRANLKGYIEAYNYSSGAQIDTLYHKVDTLGKTANASLAGEISVGLSYRHGDVWMAEFDYTRSDWTGSNFDKINGFRGNTNPSSSGGQSYSAFKTTVAESYRFGLEIIPNKNDIRYYMKKVAYRAGAYYKKEHYLLDGNVVGAAGITLGATFPVKLTNGLTNGLTVAVDFGRRGSLVGNMIRENYINFSIGINIYDIWFQKPTYN